TRTRVEVLDGERVSHREDALATEEPMEIRLAWPGRPPEPLAVTVRAPRAARGDDADSRERLRAGRRVLPRRRLHRRRRRYRCLLQRCRAQPRAALQHRHRDPGRSSGARPGATAWADLS